MADNRGAFSSNFGAIATAIGSAVGLGNMWRFPYLFGEHGGMAFLLLYLLLIAIIGIPMCLTEFSLGRLTKLNPVGAISSLAKKNNIPWLKYAGYIFFASVIMIMGFYPVVSSWTLQYTGLAFLGDVSSVVDGKTVELFASVTQSGYGSFIALSIFFILIGFIAVIGVNKGLEKWNKVLVPSLFILVFFLAVYVFFLPGSSKGYEYIFRFDPQDLSRQAFIDALGQVFFSLSMGTGTLLTLGSYMNKKDNLLKSVFTLAISDTFVATMAVFVIFPALFAYGIPSSEGGGLAFMSFPAIFSGIGGTMGHGLAILFFTTLFVAALTSVISILEVVIVIIMEQFNKTRKSAVLISIPILFVLAVVLALSMRDDTFGKIDGVTIKNLFDLTNYVASNYMFPIGGLLGLLFAGWFVMKTDLQKEANLTRSSFFKVYYFLLKWVLPIVIVTILVSQFLPKVEKNKDTPKQEEVVTPTEELTTAVDSTQN